ncbi:MAG: hypothetical protein AB7E29_04455 [Xanthobacter sp.]
MFWRYVIAMVITVIAILLAVILGDYGPWYLSWLLGTGFMILVAVCAGVLFEAQDDAERGISEPIIKLEDEPAAENAKG